MKKPEQIPPVVNPQGSNKEMLNSLQKETFAYFLQSFNANTGLVADSTMPGSPSSTGVVGMTLTVYVIAAEHSFMAKHEAVERTLTILRFYYNSSQGTSPEDIGYKGFYYHFLDMETGKRAWESELSTIDTAFLLAGALTAAMYFSGDDEKEKEIRDLADKLYRRADWQWAMNKGKTLTHGWKPEKGFLRYRWNKNYSEAHILYLLAMGSPTYPIKSEAYKKWISTFEIKHAYDIDYLYAGPLFIHQFSHMWIDFNGINDEFTSMYGFDYFENSKRATYVHRAYAIDNPLKFKRYGNYCWGLTASDGPGKRVLNVDGIKRNFFGYRARGAPFGPDDGTVSPWAVVASLPFAPEIVVETIRNAIENFNLKKENLYGFDASFNPTFPEKTKNPFGWVSPYRFGLNQAPVIIMIENYHSQLIWKLLKKCSYIKTGLRSAGFTGGWLSEG